METKDMENLETQQEEQVLLTSKTNKVSYPPPILHHHPSAEIREAQHTFQQVVKEELQLLLNTGMDREIAVKRLLYRIVESAEQPIEADIRKVMRQFQMNYDDAVRALIVKQEIGRLKARGFDAFAAIKELTRKMKRSLPLVSSNGTVEVLSEEDGQLEKTQDRDIQYDDEEEKRPAQSLCQRIGNVSISTAQLTSATITDNTSMEQGLNEVHESRKRRMRSSSFSSSRSDQSNENSSNDHESIEEGSDSNESSTSTLRDHEDFIDSIQAHDRDVHYMFSSRSSLNQKSSSSATRSHPHKKQKLRMETSNFYPFRRRVGSPLPPTFTDSNITSGNRSPIFAPSILPTNSNKRRRETWSVRGRSSSESSASSYGSHENDDEENPVESDENDVLFFEPQSKRHKSQIRY